VAYYICGNSIRVLEPDDPGAYELGHWKFDPEKQVYLHGWVRAKESGDGDKYPAPMFDDLEDYPLNPVEDFINGMEVEDKQKEVLKTLIKGLYEEAKL
jgi:hypothetical protein